MENDLVALMEKAGFKFAVGDLVEKRGGVVKRLAPLVVISRWLGQGSDRFQKRYQVSLWIYGTNGPHDLFAMFNEEELVVYPEVAAIERDNAK